ncbi:hypothetical protein ACHAO4_002378 [Trichoderma viride]
MLHEADHRKYICHFPGCHYPVFSSARTLKGHIREVHAQSNRAVPRNSIRKRVQPSDLTLSLQQDVYAEAINAKRPAKIADDKNVNQNLEKDKLSIVTQTSQIKEDDDKDNITEDDEYNATTFSPSRKNASLNRILKSRSITHSRGGVPLTAKRGRNKRQVRIKLSDGKSYVTDLNVQTLNRTEGFHNVTDEEKGPWISDDPTEEQLKEMQETQRMLDPGASDL